MSDKPVRKGLTQECPYCGAPMSRPEHNRGGDRCSVCGEWCTAYEIDGVLKWYTYPLPWDVYFAAFEKDPEVVEND